MPPEQRHHLYDFRTTKEMFLHTWVNKPLPFKVQLFSSLSQDMKVSITQLKCTQLSFIHLEDKGAILCLTNDTKFHQCFRNIIYTVHL